MIEADAFVKAVGGRSYIPIDELANQTKGFFAVAVVVDRSGVQTAKSGRKFIAVKFSDLQKYDRQKVIKSLENLPESTVKTQMRTFNKNMYRVITVMAFGDFAVQVHKVC